jgi:hypothetical protein
MGVFAAALYLGKAGAVQSKRLEGHPGMEYEPDNLGSLSACTRNRFASATVAQAFPLIVR